MGLQRRGLSRAQVPVWGALWRDRVRRSGLLLAILAIGCSSEATPAPAATTAGPTPSKAVLTGPLHAKVKNRAVILQWEEDEFQYHCLTLTQPRADKPAPVELVICPNASGRTTVTIGDEPGVGGVDYAWSSMTDFSQGAATWVLRGGSAYGYGNKNDVAKGTVVLGPHFDGACTSKDAEAAGLFEWQDKAPVTLEVAIKLSAAARSEIAITTPEVWVDNVTAKGQASAGGTLTFNYTFDTAGMYTVELNNPGGGAILNCAIYVGAAIPLIPVEVGGGKGLNDAPTPEQLTTMRKQLLGLINATRATVALAPLKLDDKLNEIAQYHSDDMGKRDYFAHVDPDGMGPGERAIKFGLAGSIGENIASHMSVAGAHSGLYWSAGHRANMLGQEWARVGLGFAKAAGNSNNILVTENFADAAPGK